MHAPEDVLPPGTLVGQYRIEGIRSQGGMAVVYEATHPVIEKRAAIKVIHRRLASDPGLIRRFVDEARAVNQIGHPNIVDVFAFGELPDGRSFMVMEWLDGDSLEARLTKGMLRLDTACQVVMTLCDALAAAHERGIVHRDMKPANVQFLSEEPLKLKLLDFGIAALGGKTTGEQGVVGTPDYMAPEQAVGEPVSSATDVYALGVMAFELVTGRRPFDEPTVEKLLLAHLQKEPPRARAYNPAVPPLFDTLIATMLAKNAPQRPTLVEVKQRVHALYQAALITSAFSGVGLARPAFERSFSDAGQVAPSLLSDLTRGHLVSVSNDPAPPPGTPIYVVLQEPLTGLVARLGATVESAIGQDQKRALLRFDAPPREALTRLASLAPSSRPASGLGQAEGRWRDAVAPLDLPTLPGVPEHAATALMTQAVARPTLSVEVVDAEIPAAVEETREPPSTSAGVRGLATKVLGLTAAMTVLAVLAVVALAYQSIEGDRSFYFESTALSTARSVAAVARSRLQGASATMVALDERDVPGLDVEGAAIASCSKSECKQLRGKKRPELESKLKTLTDLQSPHLVKTQDNLLFVQPQNGRAVGTLFTPESLVPSSVWRGVSATYIVDAAGALLMQYGDLPLSLSPIPDSGSGSKVLKDKGVVAAWAVSPEFTVVTHLPTNISNRAVQTLMGNVAIATAVVLVVALLISLLFSRQLTGRLRRLASHAGRMSRGDFSPPRDIRGKDEVGQLAQALQDMAQALEDRDREILKIQRDNRADENRSLQRSTVDALQARVMDSLHRIEELSAQEGGDISLKHVRNLTKEAQSALQEAGVTAGVARARIDFASVVEDAVNHARQVRPEIKLGFSAPNAVLFPQVDRPESLVREVIREIGVAFVKGAERSDVARVVLSESEGTLLFELVMGSIKGSEAVAQRVRALGEPLAVLSRSVKMGRRGSDTVLLISFETEAPT